MNWDDFLNVMRQTDEERKKLKFFNQYNPNYISPKNEKKDNLIFSIPYSELKKSIKLLPIDRIIHLEVEDVPSEMRLKDLIEELGPREKWTNLLKIDMKSTETKYTLDNKIVVCWGTMTFRDIHLKNPSWVIFSNSEDVDRSFDGKLSKKHHIESSVGFCRMKQGLYIQCTKVGIYNGKIGQIVKSSWGEYEKKCVIVTTLGKTLQLRHGEYIILDWLYLHDLSSKHTKLFGDVIYLNMTKGLYSLPKHEDLLRLSQICTGTIYVCGSTVKKMKDRYDCEDMCFNLSDEEKKLRQLKWASTADGDDSIIASDDESIGEIPSTHQPTIDIDSTTTGGLKRTRTASNGDIVDTSLSSDEEEFCD